MKREKGIKRERGEDREQHHKARFWPHCKPYLKLMKVKTQCNYLFTPGIMKSGKQGDILGCVGVLEEGVWEGFAGCGLLGSLRNYHYASISLSTYLIYRNFHLIISINPSISLFM